MPTATQLGGGITIGLSGSTGTGHADPDRAGARRGRRLFRPGGIFSPARRGDRGAGRHRAGGRGRLAKRGAIHLSRIIPAALLLGIGTARASDTELAQQLSNPIASLISAPFQFNYDRGFGPDDGYRSVLNIQPVVPIELNEDWNLISRTILPVITQHNIAGRSGTQSGIGDITQSLFLSPRAPGPGGLIWGAGPVFLIPTASDDMLGTGRWGAGPTGVALRQSGPWTYGVLANHIWSFAGNEGRSEVSTTLLQPFLAYTTANAWTFGLNSESIYDWTAGEWSVPINFTIGKLVKFGAQPVSFTAGVRYWAAAPVNGPEGFGFRGVITLLFPK